MLRCWDFKSSYSSSCAKPSIKPWRCTGGRGRYNATHSWSRN